MKQLYKYQREMVERAGKSTALFWDMGLGKTITSLEIYKKHKLDRLFVISPLSMLDEWKREYDSQVGVGTSWHYKEIVKQSKKLGITFEEFLVLKDVQCIVLNYEMVWRIQDYGWVDERTMIICDESHKIKNHGSKVGKYMKFLKVKTPYKICLTGTPQSSGYIDYYNQLYFLDIMDMTYYQFRERYCVYEDVVMGGVKFKELVGYRNIDELTEYYLDKCDFLRMERVYDEVVKYNQVKIPVTPAYRRVLEDRVMYFDKEGKVISNRSQINAYLRDGESDIVMDFKMLDNPGATRFALRSLLDSEHKHMWLKDLLESYDKRIVIFYNYIHELESIKRVVEAVRGDLSDLSEYNGQQKDFDNFKRSERGVAVCNYKSGSFGINDLVISNVFVAYSPTDNYLEWEQSKKRIDRDGQKNTPIYYFLESGLESRIYGSLKIGQNYDDKVFISELKEDLI